MKGRFPDFVIAGPGKSGSSSLHNYLCQHKDVFMCPSKEPNYFAFEGRRPVYGGPSDGVIFNSTVVYDRDAYRQMFAGSDGFRAVGESSLYVHFPQSAAVIARYVPTMKFIFILRNPVERAYSLYAHMLRDGYETLSFGQALRAEDERVKNNWSPPYRYFRSGLVADSLEKFIQCFPSKQIFIGRYEDFQRDNSAFLASVCEFLEIDSSFRFFPVRSNTGGVPRNRVIHDIFYRLAGRENVIKAVLKPLLNEPRRVWLREQVDKVIRVNLKKPSIAVEDYNMLVDRYADDVKKTALLTGFDLSVWTEKKSR